MCKYCKFPEQNPIDEQVSQLQAQKRRMKTKYKEQQEKKKKIELRKKLKKEAYKLVCFKCSKPYGWSLVNTCKTNHYCSLNCLIAIYTKYNTDKKE
jgi:hypothetical protein